MDPSSLVREKQLRDVRSSRIKLVFMIGLLIVVVAAMVQLGHKQFQSIRSGTAGRGAEGEPSLADQKPIPLPPTEGPEFTPLGKTPGKLAVTEEEVAKESPFMTDPKTLEQIHDQSTELEPAPFFYMLYHTFRETDEKLKAEAIPDPEWKTLWDKSSELRGKAIRVQGRIIAIWRQPLGTNLMGLNDVWAYRVRADNAPIHSKGHFFDVYSLEKLRGALRHDHVTAYGLFLKALVSEPERIDDPDFYVAVAIARRIEPLTYIGQPTIPEPIVAGNRPEARAFYWLLNHCMKTPFPTLSKEANPKLTYLDFANHPERYVAKPVAITGELRRLIRIALPENILGVPSVYYGQVADFDRKINTFYCANVPEGIHLHDPVIVTGYYLKNWNYVSEGGDEIISPVFVAKQMQVVESEQGQSTSLQFLLVGIIVGTVAVVLAVVIVERRRDRTVLEARRQHELSRIPGQLNEIARQRAAEAHGRAPAKSPDPAPPPPSPS